MKFRLVLAIGLSFGILFAQEYPESPYNPEAWRSRPASTRFKESNWPGGQFFGADQQVSSSEPGYGYPFHSGVIVGISDTIEVTVSLLNRSTSDIIIGSQTPEAWFVPYVYPIDADVLIDPVLFDTSDFYYTFKHWRLSGTGWRKVAKPYSLIKEPNDPGTYLLAYRLWGLPTGEYRIIFKKTASAPSNLRLIYGWGKSDVWITSAVTVADTVNAFAACCWRSYYAAMDTMAIAWTDTILKYHPKSIVGYALRSTLYRNLGDSAKSLASLDSVIAFCSNQSDRALPDTASMNYYQKWWWNTTITEIQASRYRLLNPKSYIELNE